MESPVVVDKPPEYHGTNERGFPFDEEEGAGAWSELAARHPDIAARLRQRPATWARKRRPSSQDATDDFGDSFGGFDRFPFDDIPSEFREHFPSHWNRRFGSREEPPQPPSQASPPPQSQPQPSPPQQQTTATQTELDDPPVEHSEHTQIPQYGLRNTVDLGKKSPADPSVVDAEERAHRSASAPPSSQPASQPAAQPAMSHDPDQPSNVRHIPIFVEGRDEPVINKTAHFGEPKPQYAPPPPQPHIDREQYFNDDGPHGFHHPPNFSRAFGTPFSKGYRQGPQPFVQQKVYPQTAFTRGASPQRSQSPKPPAPPDEFVKVPVHHEQPPPAARAQPKPPPPAPQPQPQREATPPHPPQPSPNDPITLILSIQTDVLNLMTEVENFAGTKNDKNYLFLDEMLTRNLIKLDNVETDGKENIRQARKEAIRCIQKCIAVLEAKAESNSKAASAAQQSQPDEEMNGSVAPDAAGNGEVEMKEATEEVKVEPQVQADAPPPQVTEPQPQAPAQTQEKPEQTPQVQQTEVAPETKEAQPQAADTRPDVNEQPSETKDEVNKPEETVDKKTPKKATKPTKKRDKSKDKKETGDSSKDESKKEVAQSEEKKEMQVDDKGDKEQGMEVDGAASQ